MAACPEPWQACSVIDWHFFQCFCCCEVATPAQLATVVLVPVCMQGVMLNLFRSRVTFVDLAAVSDVALNPTSALCACKKTQERKKRCDRQGPQTRKLLRRLGLRFPNLTLALEQQPQAIAGCRRDPSCTPCSTGSCQFGLTLVSGLWSTRTQCDAPKH